LLEIARLGTTKFFGDADIECDAPGKEKKIALTELKGDDESSGTFDA